MLCDFVFPEFRNALSDRTGTNVTAIGQSDVAIFCSLLRELSSIAIDARVATLVLPTVVLLFCNTYLLPPPFLLFLQVKVDELDAKLAYIQVTHVIPFFSKDELDQRLNEFEQNHDVDTFMYETPFTKSGAARGSVEDQWKRKTVIKSEYSVYLNH